MPLHDYQAALYHWQVAQHGEGDDVEPMSSDEFDHLLAMHGAVH